VVFFDRVRLALASAYMILVVGCYDGDHLGFVPCQASDECDAPPRAQTRRACLHVAGDRTLPGYCALPCTSALECANEAPGTADQEATCAGADGSDSGHCALPCSASQPCPSGMQCLSYRTPTCTEDETCACFPIVSETEG
jgi:hypothetical protein